MWIAPFFLAVKTTKTGVAAIFSVPTSEEKSVCNPHGPVPFNETVTALILFLVMWNKLFTFGWWILCCWSWVLLYIRGFWLRLNSLVGVIRGFRLGFNLLGIGVVWGFSYGDVSSNCGILVREGRRRVQGTVLLQGREERDEVEVWADLGESLLFLLIQIQESNHLLFPLIRRFPPLVLGRKGDLLRNPQDKEESSLPVCLERRRRFHYSLITLGIKQRVGRSEWNVIFQPFGSMVVHGD